MLPAWEGVDPALAEQLETAIRLGLATDPARRPATPGELVERLRAGWGATLPTGVTTFCLSDIVGSTELWERDPGAMAAALVRHDELIAGAVEVHGGRFLKSKGEGDATFSVFESASDAVEAAIAATRALGAEQWPGARQIAVRFGVHTGEAERRDADYFGPTVNLAARVRGQADGGEILLSQLAADLTGEHLPAGYSLVDLGPHRLRGVEGLQTLHAVAGPGVTAPLPATQCPYRGLLAFDAADREFFFGREHVVRSVLERLVPRRPLALVGASGSGKSSLLRAGLIASVDGGDVPGVAAARLLQPGPHPPAEIGEDAKTLVVVDQFEELFTLCEDREARQLFIDALLAHRGPVVIGVRADFYGEVSAHPELADAVASNQVLLGAMSEDELRRAVIEPARLAGLRLEPGLVDVVLGEVAGEPGALPLLSHALRATWERRDGRTLTIDAYRASGGVASAIAKTADTVVESVPPDRQGLIRNLFLRMTEPGEGIDDTRRRVAVDELVPQGASSGDVQSLLNRLADERLVTLREGTAEVAHEVLIREWPTLRGWLEEDRASIRVHRQLDNAARLWEAGGREAGDLYRGTRLAAGLDWAEAHADALNATERAFLDASLAESDRERRAQLRVNRRLRALLAGAGVLLVAAVIAGLLALRASDNATDSAVTADAQRLGAQALVDDQLERSLLLAEAGRTLQDSVATRGYLLSALIRHPGALGVIPGSGRPLHTLAVRADGRLLAAAGDDGRVALIDTRSRRRVRAPIRASDFVITLDFSPDGKLIAAAGATSTGPDGQGVVLVDVASGRRVREIEARYPQKIRSDVSQSRYIDGRFSADGRTLIAITSINDDWEGDHPTYVRRFDVRTGRPRGPAVRVGRDETTVSSVVDARRDRLIMTSTREKATFVVNADTLRVRRFETGAFTAGIAPDGRTAALGGKDGSVAILDLRTGRRRTLAGRHEGLVQQLAFSADGRTLATTGDDARVLVWDLDRDNVRETLTGHRGRITSLSVSRDGRTLYTAGHDSTIIVWDIARDRRLARAFRAGNPITEIFPPALAVSPDGRRVAAGLQGGGVRLHDARTLRPLGDLPGTEGLATAVEFSPDGRTMAVTGKGGAVELRDPSSGRRLRPPLPSLGPPPAHDAQALGFSADGKRIAVADLSGNLRVLDLRSGRIRRAGLPGYATHLSFSPDGELLAVALDAQGVQLRDGHSLEVVARLRGDHDHARWARFSPDGRLLALSSFQGYTQLWDVASRRPTGPRLTGHEGGTLGAEFSPDGRMMATTGTDGTAILWDVASRRTLGTLPGRNGGVMSRFTPDGRWLFVLNGLTGDAERWEVTPDAWAQRACSVAGRQLTRAEWDEFVPDQDPREVCGS